MKQFSLFLFAILFATDIASVAVAQSAVDLNATIPVDPNVRIGKLANGLTYYIRHNAKPEKRVELRLAVNAGSLYETNAQQGLAHFTEHMCFNGTTHFPKNELVNYFQSIGMSFGGDINAYTSFAETVYMLHVPTDKEELVEKGYQVLEDWAHNVTMDGKEIDKERGVITEEWRLGLGADDRMMKRWLPEVLKNSMYAERIPIGKIDIIKNFKHESLRQFYHDWYRPNLMAVIVVGDINIDATEASIKAHFSSIENPANPKERIEYSLPDNNEPLIAVETDKEATENTLMLFYKHPRKIEKDLADYREVFKQELYNNMLNSRLNEILQQPDAPFVYAYTAYGNFLARTQDAYTSYAMMKENQIEKGIETILTENERVKRYGFSETEFERQKQEMLSKYEKEAKEFDKTESVNYTSEYVDNFLAGNPIPGEKNKLELLKQLLPGIQLSEINELPKSWITDKNLAIVVTAPEKEGVKVPTKQQILDIIKSIKNKEIAPYVDKFKEAPLLSEILKGSAISATKENKEIGYTEITLNNGIKVVLKPTDFKNDEIQFSAYSTGGSSLYPDKDIMSANSASTVIDQSGVGNFDNVELEKKLKGKVVKIYPYIDDLKEGFKGNASPKDFETLLQLTYLYFTAPRQDTTALKTYVSKTKNQLKFIKSNPMYAFYDTLIKTSTQNNPRVVVIPTEAQLTSINMDKLYSIYRDRFADASDFKFFIVGTFKSDTLIPMLEKYLGSLPVIRRTETWKDVSPVFPAGITEVKIHKGTEPKSMVGIIFSEPIQWDAKNRTCLTMLNEIMQIKLVEVVREKMSGVYSPQTMINMDKYPKSEFSFMTMFGCSPKNADKLTKAVLKIVAQIQKKGPSEIDLNKAKEKLIRERETDIKTNTFWLNRLETSYFNEDEVYSQEKFNELVNSITTQDLKQAAIKYLNRNHYVRAVLLPEEK